MKILYKPFGIVAGIISGRLARKIFEALWARIDKRPPPKPGVEHTDVPKAIAAAAIEAATYAATRAAVNRASLKSFQHLTGIWAGEKEKAKKKE